jgi:hypothetical protein
MELDSIKISYSKEDFPVCLNNSRDLSFEIFSRFIYYADLKLPYLQLLLCLKSLIRLFVDKI